MSKVLTTAQPGPVPGSTTEKIPLIHYPGSRGGDDSTSNSHLPPSIPAAIPAAFREIPFTLFPCVECKNQWNNHLLHFHSSNCRADKDCRMFIHVRELENDVGIEVCVTPNNCAWVLKITFERETPEGWIKQRCTRTGAPFTLIQILLIPQSTAKGLDKATKTKVEIQRKMIKSRTHL